VDPPPELVIEIDLSSPSLNKLPIYARLGISEVWRYDGERMTILVLEDSDYAQTTESTVLGPATESALTGFIEKGKPMKRKHWLRTVREWARQNTGPSE
jgi:Uma2 family endonuclease